MRRSAAVALVLAVFGVPTPAEASLWTTIRPPFERAVACWGPEPVTCRSSSLVAAAPPFAYADVGGFASGDAARVAVLGTGTASVGIGFVAPAGSTSHVRVEVDVTSAGGDVCLLVGGTAAACTATSGPQLLEATVVAPPNATRVVDPAVRASSGAAARVLSIAYLV